jgi:ankyrin repeat protein
MDSSDKRKHTALSEAASQNHTEIVEFLLTSGADPNSVSDTGRSALWRSAFAGHLETCEILLRAGADPDLRETVGMESAYDVSKNEDVRQLLGDWDRKETDRLMEVLLIFFFLSFPSCSSCSSYCPLSV